MTSAAAHAPEVSQRRETLILWLACVAQFMVILDVSVVNVALPSIGRALHYTPTGLQWVVNAYVLAFAGFLLLGGRAADLFGRRRIFLLGAILFAVASLAGGLATTSGMLTAARVAQGFGGAFLSPATLTIIVTTFHGPRLPKALGAWGAVGGAGGAIGSLAGGILTAELSWRWVLFINVPIGIAVVIGALLWLPELTRQGPKAKLDVPGAILVTAGLSALVYAIVGTDTHPWGSGTTLAWLGAAVVLLLGFVLVETKVATAPLIPFSFLVKRTTASANFVMMLVGAAFFSMWYFLTLYIQEVLGYSALRTGFAFAPMAVAIIIGAQIASRTMQKFGVWRLILVGTIIACLGFFWLSHLTSPGGYWSDVFGGAITISFALGLLFSPLAAAATSQAGPTEAGLASGLLNTSRQIGGAVGLAVLATIAVDATTRALGGGHPSFGGAISASTKEALTHGYNIAFFVGSMICLAAVIATFLIPRATGRAMMQKAAAAPHEETIVLPAE
jgi:EmrB/QacA subfamily drug resistance transporter